MLELRGNALVVHYARKYRLVTCCFSMTGATRELRPSYHFQMLWYGLTAALFTLVSFGPLSARFGLDIGSPALLFLIEFSTVATGLWCLVHCFPTSAIEFRFNTEDGVFSLTIKDDRAQNPSLASITEHFRPFELQYHQYEFGSSVHFFSERGYSVPFSQQFDQVLGYLLMLLSPLVPVMQGLFIQHRAPKLAIFCFCFAPVFAIGMFNLIRRPRVDSKPQPCPNELRTNRKALRLLAHGDTVTAINTLVAFLHESSDATHARKLLAQIYVIHADNDDALALFQPLPDSAPDTMAEFVEKLECFKSMTKAEMSTIN
ncbi:MAG: tetratricopeptide repeat protein [Candidatus Hydrogenedentes bacterium]|nr:tetratricopeptide repeat protein [Candidatus Hydrogenedentota bacterium]